MKPTVVILLSDKRSGSTMFERELCKHAEIQTVVHTPHSYNETHHWLKAAVILDSPPQMFAGGAVYKNYGSKGNARLYLLDEVQGNEPAYQDPGTDRELVFGGWEAMCRKFAKPVFFEKSPQHLPNWAALSLLLEWSQQTDFDVKFIGLVRNPLSVLYSAQELFNTDPVSRQFAWAQTYRNLLAFRALVKPEQFHFVRYEDLISDATTQFAEICRFIGVEPREEVGREVHAKSLYKWREDPAFAVQLDATVKQLARHYGYSERDLDNPGKDRAVAGAPLKHQRKGALRKIRARLRDRIVKPLQMWIKRRQA